MERYQPKNILITGAAGFIGSHVANWLTRSYSEYRIIVLDKLDYCSNLKNLEPSHSLPNFKFVKGDICSADFVYFILATESIDTVMHFAAQTHVDNSFGNSFEFIRNNVYGTCVLLEACKVFGHIKRFIHVSTDEGYLHERAASPDSWRRVYLYCEDVAEAFDTIVHRGEVGHIYNIGTEEEKSVLDVAEDICQLFSLLDGSVVIKVVKNWPFNDQRYFLDSQKLKNLGWSEKTKWEDGLKKTMEWYIQNPDWWGDVSFALHPHPRMLSVSGMGKDHREAGFGASSSYTLQNSNEDKKKVVEKRHLLVCAKADFNIGM